MWSRVQGGRVLNTGERKRHCEGDTWANGDSREGIWEKHSKQKELGLLLSNVGKCGREGL